MPDGPASGTDAAWQRGAKESIVRKRILGVVALSAVLVAGAGGLTACGSSDSGSDSKTITYWASNQGSSIQNDKDVLGPELKKFTKQTGIKVKLQVIGWNDLLNKITTATTSGQGPDVVNIGNTWSASLQATGAFVDFDKSHMDTIGGQDKFLATSMSSTGAAGKTPTSVPLYGLSYGLFYNKKMFADAGIKNPPSSWQELVTDAKKLTKPGGKQYGITLAGASYTENAHFAFIFGQQQGGNFFDKSGKPTFDTPQNVKAVQQYTDLISKDKVATPASAEHTTTNDAVEDFTSGKAAMLLGQNNTNTGIEANGMKASDYAVAPIPMLSPLPAGGKKINSHVAGINIAAFKGGNETGAMKFIKFMTSAKEQVILDKAFNALPVTSEAAKDPAFQTPENKMFVDVLANTAAPMPMITDESQFETTVGNAMKDLIAQAATGKSVSAADVKKSLGDAQQKMQSGG
ncbi:sugar ABC transporter substrate-binding protein [Actinocatenispora thailandica]|uniref:Sugar ABC transporter substrate-binding protein n=1 Tax=Actinocatenispora thailandica TaxID=227318 RepID=A0A7R7DS67_9ACTN|nr:sugar ABC transporter substrate-binding protein [Actinocatenispora thailandica]